MRQPNIEEIPARPGILEILREAVQSSAAETRKFAEYFPVIGDVIQGIDALSAAQGGRYGEAALLGGVAILPGAIGSIRKSDPLGWFLQSKINPANTGGTFEETKRTLQELIRTDAQIPHPLEGQKRKFNVQHSTSAFFSQPELRRVDRTTGMGDQWQGQGALYMTEVPRDGSRSAVTQFYREQTGTKVPQLVVSLPNSRRAYNVGTYYDGLRKEEANLRTWIRNTVNREKEAGYRARLAEVQRNLSLVQRMTSTIRDPLSSDAAYRDAIKAAQDSYQKARIKQQELEKALPVNWREQVAAIKAKSRTPGASWNTAAEKSLLMKVFEHQALTNDQRSALGLMNDFQAALAGKQVRTGNVSKQNTYEIDFFANPDELYNLGRPIDQQKAAQRLVAGLNEFTVPSGTPAGGTPLGDHLAWVQSQYPRVMGRDKIYDLNEVILGNNPHNQFTALRPTLTDADQWQVMEALRSKGIVGNRYLTRFAAENPTAPQLSNFVLTEPSRAKFVDLWSVLPFAATSTAVGGAAMRAQQESQQSRTYNTNPRARRPGT